VSKVKYFTYFSSSVGRLYNRGSQSNEHLYSVAEKNRGIECIMQATGLFGDLVLTILHHRMVLHPTKQR